MEFTTLDYYILKLLTEHPRATEHIIKSHLHAHINNRKHLMVRLERMIINGFIRSHNNVAYTLGTLGMLVMGIREPDANQKKIMAERHIPSRLTLDYIDKQRQARLAISAQAQRAPSQPTSENTTRPEDAESKIATSHLTSLHAKLKKRARGVNAQTKMPKTKVATPTSTSQSEKAKNTPPSTPNPISKSTAKINKRKDAIMIPEIKNADIYCLTTIEKQLVGLIHVMQPVPENRLKEQLALQGQRVSAQLIQSSLSALQARQMIRHDKDDRFQMMEGQSFALGIGEDAPRRENNETAIFELSRVERIIMELTLQHKRDVLSRTKIPGLLKRCDEARNDLDIDAVIASLIERHALERRENKCYYATHLFLLAARQKKYSPKWHSRFVESFTNPSAFDFLTKGTTVPIVKTTTDKKEATAEPQKPASTPAQEKAPEQEKTENAGSSTEKDTPISPSTEQTESEAMTENVSDNTIEKELSGMMKKLSAPDIHIDNLDEKLQLLIHIDNMLPAEAKQSKALVTGIMSDLKKLNNDNT